MLDKENRFKYFRDVPEDILKLPTGHPLSRAVGRLTVMKMREGFVHPEILEEIVSTRNDPKDS